MKGGEDIEKKAFIAFSSYDGCGSRSERYAHDGICVGQELWIQSYDQV
jgi:hypothetical protein